jgi:uncharacterized coiled-coil DUF342 family protein
MQYDLKYVKDEINRTKTEIRNLNAELASMCDIVHGKGVLPDFREDAEPVIGQIKALTAHLHYAQDCYEVLSKLAGGKGYVEVKDSKGLKGKIDSVTDRMIALKQSGLLDEATEKKLKAEIEELQKQLKEAEKLEKTAEQYREFYEQCYRLSHSAKAIRAKLYRR